MKRFLSFPGFGALATGVCDLIAERAERSVTERGRFLLVLSGGETPAPLYDELAARRGLPWARTHVFWGDERCVPATDPRSNCALAEARLLSRVDLPRSHVHPAPVEAGPPEQAARQWEERLREFFGPEVPFPVFDLILLGVGSDGHTASLFPGHPALEERSRWAAAVEHPGADPAVARLTLTLPVLNQGRCVAFLAGAEKRAVVEVIRRGGRGASLLPAAKVRPSGDLYVCVSGR